MIEKGIRGGICQAMQRYTKANNKYIKNYNKEIISSYLMYLDANNLHGWTMSQKLPMNGFKWVKNLSQFNESFIRNYDEKNDIGYFLKVDIDYSEKLFNLHKDLPFLPERKKINKVEKLICSIEDKQKYVIHIRVLKQALNHRLVLRKVHRVIQSSQEIWLKPYIDMNTKLRKEAKNDFEKDFFNLINNSVFGKAMENVRKHRDVKLVTTDIEINKLVPEPNYYTTKDFSENLLAIEMKKAKVTMNKPAYLVMSILDITKALMYNFWYDYIKPKYEDRAKLCHTDTDSFIIQIITEDFFVVISADVERWFDTSNSDENDKRPLPIGKNKKVIEFFKNE